tara:strand:- start:1742 stop:2548 length:807 start_codon:yes stop_codon:yes gene_type:complete
LETYFFISLCLALGLFSGFLGGLLGIGGGVVIVPILYFLYTFTGEYSPEVAMLVAIATSLSCIVFTSASAALTQIKAQRVNWNIVCKLLPFLLVGSFSAGYIAPNLPPGILRWFFGIFIGLISIIMLTNWKPEPNRTLPGYLGSSFIGAIAGLIAGLAGIAGGNAIVPALIFFNIPAHNATATASTLGVPIAGVGAMSYFILAPTNDIPNLFGYIDGVAFLSIVIGAVIMAPLGVKFAQKVPAIRLKKVFGAMLMLVSLRMLLGPFLL